MCLELLWAAKSVLPQNPFSFGKKEEGLKLQELTSCFSNGLADSRNGQVPVIIPLYCINTYWKNTWRWQRVAAPCPSKSLWCCPRGPTKHSQESKSSWEHSRLCHRPHLGHTRWTDRKRRSEHGLGVCSRRGEGPGAPLLPSRSLPLAMWPPGPWPALLTTPRASLLLVLWLELSPRPMRILPGPEGNSGLEQ